MADVVLDASAVLAMVYGEPGADHVLAVLPTAILSSVNAAEVIGRLIRDGVSAQAATAQVRGLPCQISAVDEAVGVRAGELFEQTRRTGLSLGDRICIALAERRGASAMTADRAWRTLDLGVEITLIR